jgi:hypothetical protein
MEEILKDIDEHIFEPNRSLEYWLATHKRPYPINGLTMFGLFNTQNTYFGAFLIAVFIEILGGFVLALDFEFGAGLGVVGGIVGALAFIFDFTIAYYSSYLNGYITYFNNKKMLYGADHKTQSYINDEISKVKTLKFISIIIIYIIAAIKIWLFYEGFGMIEMPVLIMTFLFILVAFIHTRYTEYFFAWFRFNRAARKEKNHARKLGETRPIPIDFYTPSALKNFIGTPEICPHDIIATNEKINIKLASGQIEERYKNELLSKGLITDSDVNTLCKSQEISQQQFLAIELLNIQLNKVTPEKYKTFINNLPQYIIKEL